MARDVEHGVVFGPFPNWGPPPGRNSSFAPRESYLRLFSVWIVLPASILRGGVAPDAKTHVADGEQMHLNPALGFVPASLMLEGVERNGAVPQIS